MRKSLVIAGIALVAAIAVIVARRSRTTDKVAPSESGTSEATNGPRSPGVDRPAITPSAGTPSGTPSSDGSEAPPGTIVQRVGSDGTVTISDGPRADGEATGSGTGSATAYTVGNVNVRDHRGSGAKPLDVPPNVHAPGGPMLESSVTNDIGQKVRAVIYACAREASREGRGTTPRIDGQFVSNIHGGELKIVSAIVQPRDLGEAASAQVKSCVESKVIGLTTPATGQSDLDSYGINISLRLP